MTVRKRVILVATLGEVLNRWDEVPEYTRWGGYSLYVPLEDENPCTKIHSAQ